MPRYYFDIHANESLDRDDDGHELPNLEAVRKETMRALPGIAHDEVRKGSDRQNFVCLVTDEDGHPVYSATLSYVGHWLIR